MSTTVWASDYKDSDSCTNAGHDWCGTTASGVCAPTGTDCCTVLNYDNACQTCTNGVVKDDYNSVCQNCDGTYNNGADCTTANNAAGVCEDGYCKPAGATLTDKDCITQAECGGTGSGYFCYYSSYSDYCTEDPATAMGCAGATTWSACSEQNSSAVKGQCKKVSTYFNKGAKIEGLGYLTKSKKVSNKGLNWWSAVNFCTAQGRSLFDLHSPTENKLQCANPAIGSGTTGKCCNDANPSCTSDVSQQSTVMQQIRNATTGFGTSGYLWTQNAKSPCVVFGVTLGDGNVGSYGRGNDSLYALCE